MGISSSSGTRQFWSLKKVMLAKFNRSSLTPLVTEIGNTVSSSKDKPKRFAYEISIMWRLSFQTDIFPDNWKSTNLLPDRSLPRREFFWVTFCHLPYFFTIRSHSYNLTNMKNKMFDNITRSGQTLFWSSRFFLDTRNLNWHAKGSILAKFLPQKLLFRSKSFSAKLTGSLPLIFHRSF